MPDKKSPPPEKMILVSQPKDSSLCLATCVAMLTGETLETVIKGCTLRLDPPDFDPWLEDKEAARYLAIHNLSYGMFACPTKTMTGNEKFINTRIPLDEPAILTVDSRGSHAVVWCPARKKVLDPQYGVVGLSKYTITYWTVIADISNED